METQAPRVSILVPAYNHENYIIPTLESCKNQHLEPTELLILDDGSSDRTFELAQAWANANQTQFARVNVRKQENKGLCATLNLLIQEARGEYVTLLASDDLLVENSLRCRVEFLEARAELWAVFGDSSPINERGDPLADSALTGLGVRTNKRALANRRLLPYELILRWNGYGPVLMVRKSAFSAVTGVGLYDESLYFDDKDMYYRLLGKGKIAFLDRVVAKYRVSVRSMSHSKASRTRMRICTLQINRKALDYFTGLPRMLQWLWVCTGEWLLERRPRFVWFPLGLLTAGCLWTIRFTYDLLVWWHIL